jgi:hypothetical protein
MICSRCKREFTSPSYKTCETCRIYNKNIQEYQNVKNSLQWVKSNYYLRHFQIAGNSLEPKLPFLCRKI